MQQIQNKVGEFVQKYNLKSNSSVIVLDLVSKVGEISKEILKATNYGRQKEELLNPEMELEVGDALYSLICLANHYGIDL
jgi:NTP pyrophosphatase (non-canonical NTP hydrolase)